MKITKLAILSSILFAGFTAQASQGTFGYIYTTETHAKGTWEYEQYNTLRTGKADGDYNALDIRNELETGVTDNLQVSIYLNSSYLKSSGVSGFADKNEFDINGISVEFIYNLMSAYKDGFGLALYVEPEVVLRSSRTGGEANKRALDTKILLQKNFMEDQVITALNIQFEPEWKRSRGDYAKSLEAGIYAGVSYLVMPKLYVGLELLNRTEFDDMNFAKQEFSNWFMGPTMNYSAEGYWWTLTAMPQISGWPKTDGGLNLDEHEKFELRFKFGIPFGG